METRPLSAKDKLLLVLPVAAMFLLLGTNIGTWASRMADIRQNMQISEAQLGFFLLATSIGAISAYPVTAWFLRTLGGRKTAITLGLFAALNLPLLLNNTSYPLGIALMFLEGMCCAGINGAMNTCGGDVERQHGFKCLAMLHAAFSLGIALASVISMGFIHLVSAALLPFSLSVGGLLLVLVGVIYTLAPRQDDRHQRDPNQPKPKEALSRHVLLLGGIVLCATIVEGAMHDWSAIYMQQVIGVRPDMVPAAILTFSVSMFVGRMFVDKLRARVADMVLIGCAGLAVWVVLSLGVMISGFGVTLVTFCLLGLVTSVISPSIYAVASGIGPRCLSFIATCGSVGGMVGPPLIGAIASYSVLTTGMYFVAANGLVIGIIAMSLSASRRPISAWSIKA